MSANLVIELKEQTLTLLSHEALAVGKTPAELAATVVEGVYGSSRQASADAASARARFEQFFGSVDLGRPVGTVNEAIDVDLAREYDLDAETA